MVVDAWTWDITPYKNSDAISVLKKARELHQQAGAALRILTHKGGDVHKITVEMEYESLDAMEEYLAKWWSSESEKIIGKAWMDSGAFVGSVTRQIYSVVK